MATNRRNSESGDARLEERVVRELLLERAQLRLGRLELARLRLDGRELPRPNLPQRAKTSTSSSTPTSTAHEATTPSSRTPRSRPPFGASPVRRSVRGATRTRALGEIRRQATDRLGAHLFDRIDLVECVCVRLVGLGLRARGKRAAGAWRGHRRRARVAFARKIRRCPFVAAEKRARGGAEYLCARSRIVALARFDDGAARPPRGPPLERQHLSWHLACRRDAPEKQSENSARVRGRSPRQIESSSIHPAACVDPGRPATPPPTWKISASASALSSVSLSCSSRASSLSNCAFTCALISTCAHHTAASHHRQPPTCQPPPRRAAPAQPTRVRAT